MIAIWGNKEHLTCVFPLWFSHDGPIKKIARLKNTYKIPSLLSAHAGIYIEHAHSQRPMGVLSPHRAAVLRVPDTVMTAARWGERTPGGHPGVLSPHQGSFFPWIGDGGVNDSI